MITIIGSTILHISLKKSNSLICPENLAKKCSLKRSDQPLLNDAVRGQTARLIHELLQPRLKMTLAIEGDHETILPGPAQLHHTLWRLELESNGYMVYIWFIMVYCGFYMVYIW